MSAKTLLVFYSVSGNTRAVARELAASLSCDTDEILDVKRRSTPLGALRSVIEAVLKKEPAIKPPTRDPRDYDLIILGGPVWASRVASPLRTYVNSYRDRFQNVALFCTYMGSGQDKMLSELATLCTKDPVTTLAMTDADIKKRRYGERLGSFVARIGAFAQQLRKLQPAA
jgi:flavodoxin